MDRPHWRAGPNGLNFARSLTISFQRYIVADAPPLPDIPRSLGLLAPRRIGPGHFLLPVHAGESVWLAFEFAQDAPSIEIAATGSAASGSARIEPREPGEFEMVAGVPDKAGRLRRLSTESGGWRTVELVAATGEPVKAKVEFVDTATFESRSGHRAPAPARSEDAYGGWRLP